MSVKTQPTQTATQNACKLCEPLGACFVFRGIEGAIPLLHGSQGCSTYIRRYMIGHFREPVDIASSSFSETTTIFGGASNLREALANVTRQYRPAMIGIATTCLSETIGDDLNLLLRGVPESGEDQPLIVPVSTPSYQGTHMDGFHAAVCAVLDRLALEPPDNNNREGFRQINLLPGLVSPADIRHLQEICTDFGLEPAILPDYSDTLDGVAGADYEAIPKGGIPPEKIARMGQAAATIAFGATIKPSRRGGELLAGRFGTPHHFQLHPIGIDETDRFFKTLESLAGRPVPAKHAGERGRLVDSYIDAHKHLFGRRAVVYGEEDLVVALAGFLNEIGMQPVLCASGGHSGLMRQAIADRIGEEKASAIRIREDADFAEIADEAEATQPDILIGNSKGYPVARALNIPLVRVGFPIHDRIGAQRVQTLGYRGTQQLFDRLVNALIEKAQDDSPVGYGQI